VQVLASSLAAVVCDHQALNGAPIQCEYYMVHHWLQHADNLLMRKVPITRTALQGADGPWGHVISNAEWEVISHCLEVRERIEAELSKRKK
jgi:hypothetical protein